MAGIIAYNTAKRTDLKIMMKSFDPYLPLCAFLAYMPGELSDNFYYHELICESWIQTILTQMHRQPDTNLKYPFSKHYKWLPSSHTTQIIIFMVKGKRLLSDTTGMNFSPMATKDPTSPALLYRQHLPLGKIRRPTYHTNPGVFLVFFMLHAFLDASEVSGSEQLPS